MAALEDAPNELQTKFAGHDSFTDAMLEYAQSKEKPMAWNPWLKDAVVIADEYEDAPKRGDNKGFSIIRNATLSQVFGEKWKDLVEHPQSVLQARALAEKKD